VFNIRDYHDITIPNITVINAGITWEIPSFSTFFSKALGDYIHQENKPIFPLAAVFFRRLKRLEKTPPWTDREMG